MGPLNGSRSFPKTLAHCSYYKIRLNLGELVVSPREFDEITSVF